MFYPQLVAGPIERPQNLLHQFKTKHHFSATNLVAGLRLMTWGFVKKLVIADRLAIYVDAIYQDPSSHHWLNLVIATIFFALQIYFDFSGYSDIAIGTAKSMGFDLMQNFNIPYIARSVSEFWRRWHISLSTWINDYLYTPLTIATRNYGKKGLLFSLMFTFLIMGLWHGASWNFVVFGALHGLVLSYETLTKKFRKKISKKMPLSIYNTSSSILVFIFWAFSLIFFRTDSMNAAIEVVKNIFTFNHQSSVRFVVIDKNAIEFGITSALIALLTTLFVFIIERKLKYDLTDLNNDKKKWVDILFTALCIVLIFVFGIFHKTSFIYFQF